MEASYMNITKTNKCPSRSGKSTITYQIGTDAEGGIHYRVYDNTGNGLFSNEWVSLEAIKKTLDVLSSHP